MAVAGPDSLPLWLCRVCAFVLLRCFSGSHTVLPKEHSLGVIFFSSLSSCKCCIFLQFYLHFTTDYTCMIVYVTNNIEPWTLILCLPMLPSVENVRVKELRLSTGECDFTKCKMFCMNMLILEHHQATNQNLGIRLQEINRFRCVNVLVFLLSCPPGFRDRLNYGYGYVYAFGQNVDPGTCLLGKIMTTALRFTHNKTHLTCPSTLFIYLSHPTSESLFCML